MWELRGLPSGEISTSQCLSPSVRGVHLRGPLILVMPVSRLQIDLDQLKVRLHTTTVVVEFWFWPTFTTTITIAFRVHRTTLEV